LNFAAAGLETAVLIESGGDWLWRGFVYDHYALSQAGLPFTYIGWGAPFAAPLAFYLTGRALKNEKAQVCGLALTQAVALTALIPTPVKMITGRAKPALVTKSNNYHVRSSRVDDFSGEFNWFNMNATDGWPSGHTAQAFAAAAVITELYKGNAPLAIGAYSYAALMGLGVSVTVHWFSDAAAGALIGYAIGKTVGKSFARLLYWRRKTRQRGVSLRNAGLYRGDVFTMKKHTALLLLSFAAVPAADLTPF
jgi:membrane-associated phospholipid phosphatase